MPALAIALQKGCRTKLIKDGLDAAAFFRVRAFHG